MSTQSYSDLPEPLVPPDTDMRNWPWFENDTGELLRFGPWLACKTNPAAGYYMKNLFDAAWHSFPAGSIEDDDDVLAHHAMCDRRDWDRNKSDVLRGWTLCRDGRWYSTYLLPKVLSSIEKKKSNKNRVRAASEARAANRKAEREASRFQTANTDRPTIATPMPRSRNGDVTLSSHEGGDDGALTPPFRDEGGTIALRSLEEKTRELREDIPKASPSGADAPPVSFGLSSAPDVRAELFGEGLTTIMGLTGRSEVACRTYLGRGLKELKDDAAVMLDIIRLAKARRPADPMSWISASIKARVVGKPSFEEKMMEAVGLDARKGGAGPIIDHSQAELLVLE